LALLFCAVFCLVSVLAFTAVFSAVLAFVATLTSVLAFALFSVFALV
jgi:hypothetical protein